MSDAIGKMIDDDKGAHRVKTLSGAVLIAKNSNGKITDCTRLACLPGPARVGQCRKSTDPTLPELQSNERTCSFLPSLRLGVERWASGHTTPQP